MIVNDRKAEHIVWSSQQGDLVMSLETNIVESIGGVGSVSEVYFCGGLPGESSY